MLAISQVDVVWGGVDVWICDVVLDVSVKQAITFRQFRTIDEFAHRTCLCVGPHNTGELIGWFTNNLDFVAYIRASFYRTASGN